MQKNGSFVLDSGKSEVAATEPLLPSVRQDRSGGVRAEAERPYFYTARELARFLRVTETTIYRLAKRGELPSFAIGRSIRFRVQDVEAFIRRAKVEREDSG